MAVKKYLDGSDGVKRLARSIKVHPSVLQQWIKQYKAVGEIAFEKRNTRYSLQFKLDVFNYNDTKDQESDQIEFNYDTRNNVIINNQISASNSRIFISNNFNKNTGNKLNYNQYFGEFIQNNGLWQWQRKTYKGFSPYQVSMNQEGNEQHSVFSKLSPSFKLILK
ncbi:UNVERIFIED_ORG: transposase [Bacillus cereus]